MNKITYEFGEFLLDLTEKRLLSGGERVSLQPKVFDLLVFFVEKNGELISRDDLMKAVWKETFVEETNLRFCIHALRKALGKKPDGEEYVETLPKRGYRFNAEVREKSSGMISAKINAAEIQGEIPPPNLLEKPRSGKRKWLIGISTISLICFSMLVFAWWKSNLQPEKKSSQPKPLAVLPFEAVNYPDNDFQIGLADAMITNLSKIKSLKVLSIASVRRFAGQNFDALAAGNELQADSVLSGSYRFEGESLRVNAVLRKVENGEILWTETFTTRRIGSIEFENAVATRAARLLWLKIAEDEDKKTLAAQKINAEAVQNYLSARKIWRSGELLRRNEMIELFEKTIVLEPNWALAQTGYAEALLTSDQFNFEWEKAEELAAKASKLDRSLAQPHTILGEIYHFRDWNWEKAESEFKQAIALDPNSAQNFYKYSQFLRLQRRFAEAEIELKKAIELEPFSPVFYCSLCQLYTFDNKTEKGLESCKYARQIEPDYWLTSKLLYWIYVQKKMYAEMDELVLGKLSPDERAAHPMAKPLAAKDLKPFFRYLLNEPSKKSGKKSERPITDAMYHVQLGEKEKALESLEKAFAVHDENLPESNADSIFDPIRNDKRFFLIMSKIGLQR